MMQTLKKLSIALGTAGVLLSSSLMIGEASAGILVFTDRASWRLAAGGGVGNLSEDFNSFSGTNNYATATGFQAGFLHFATITPGFLPGDPSWSVRSAPDVAGSKTVNGSPYVSLVTFSPPGGDTLITTASLAAFGFDYSGPSNTPSNDANPLHVITSNLDNITGPTILGDSSGFFGFVYTAGETFTSLEIRDPDDRTFFGADNFEAFSTVSAAPEPASLALLGIGLAGLGLGRRRKA